jgi:8-oxo-dGTP pyrophosphatase MutT (NUDIX family)
MRFGRQANIVLVFDPHGNVLALRRGKTDPWKPGRWNFPGGMRDATDLTAQHGASRELLEETGFYVPPDQLHWAFSYRYPLLINVFWVKLNRRPRVTMPDGEHDKYVWCKLWEIPQPTIPHVPYIVQQVTGKTWNLSPSSL